ncbi:unnamed protein product [Arctia plantaginis]|uniref:Beta-1,4-N-acetylgalactosaminyltransferase n=1 Tax=Arctia plantaginis TaxID=874455 RepID=A0A8S1B8I9_ARCPL|nr:unnamed protein product [Arctia plantaginis]
MGLGCKNAAGGRISRALRLLVLIVLALVTIEYVYGWIFGATYIRTYLSARLYNITQFTFRDNETQIKNETATTRPLPGTLCDLTPSGLGPVRVNKTEVELASLENKFPEVGLGGRYTPPNCTPRHKVAIIVPYKDREQHLAIFLSHMHPFLMKQQIAYGIFIVEQAGSKSFNRAKLLNVGFVESQKWESGGYQCFIFHDIDLLPEDTRNMYSCPEQPRHMSAAIDKFKYKLPYQTIFGGVSALTEEQFKKVNGFSNRYWGWGGEDDDMYKRLNAMNYKISRYAMNIAKYVMLDHKKSAPNPKRQSILKQTDKVFKEDGLSTLEYELIKMVRFQLYTYLVADIDKES